MSVLARAHADVASGRAWKARDRLRGALANQPHDQDILTLLGEITFALGDLPAAGATWWLTERRGDDVDAAWAALEERAGHNAAELLRQIKPRRPVDRYPAPVAERIAVLVRDAGDESHYRWRFEDPPAPLPRVDTSWRPSATDRLYDGALLVGLAGPWALGVLVLARRAARLRRR